jgi:hypothetical protein
MSKINLEVELDVRLLPDIDKVMLEKAIQFFVMGSLSVGGMDPESEFINYDDEQLSALQKFLTSRCSPPRNVKVKVNNIEISEEEDKNYFKLLQLAINVRSQVLLNPSNRLN